MNTGFYVFFVCTYISTFVLDWILETKKRSYPRSSFYAAVGSVTKLDLLVHFVNNQSLCVCLRGNPISQALKLSL